MESGWRKSSFSGQNGSCVETASADGAILVRDTTNRDGGTLSFGTAAWADLVTRIKGL
jgi:hypothetical protein